MKKKLNLTPLGCGPAAGHLPNPFQDPEQNADPDFPADFLPRLKHLDLGLEEIYLAWELVRLTGRALDPGQQRALMLLVLAARLASSEGSTRLPLAADGYLHRVLEEFKTTTGERAAIAELLIAAQQVDDSTPAATGLAVLFGGPGDYRPLIFDHDCLYLQKLHVLETRVGENLRARLADEPGAAAAAAGGIAGLDAPPAATGGSGGGLSIPSAAAGGGGGGGDAVSTAGQNGLLNGGIDRNLEKALQEVFAHPPLGPAGKIELDAEQKKAVKAALTGRIAVISGRPGSGKTSIVASMLRVLARAGQPPLESIALAAPTGKAAERMRQAITAHLAAIPEPAAADCRLADACPPSLTLHRLLGYSPQADRFWHNEYNPLSEQLIIVDESSMVDLALMDQLLRALQPESRVIFLGDADQLPAVGVGAVLRDLCRAEKAIGPGRAVVLKQSYRAREEDSAGKKILDVAAAINAGLAPTTAGNGRSFRIVNRARELCCQGVEHLEATKPEQVETFLNKWLHLFQAKLQNLDQQLFREHATGPAGFDEQTAGVLQQLLDHYERFRILCVTRVTAGGTGTEAVNNWFHRRWAKNFKKAGEGGMKNAGPISPASYFWAGEPVLVTRNDYNLRLFNGDAGLLLLVKPAADTGSRPPAELMAVFPRSGSFVAYPLETLRGKLELAWATTVHKAQGSAYDHVAIILPGVPVRPLTKELLYTATTRAKKSVTFVGSLAVLESGVKRKMERTSGLAAML